MDGFLIELPSEIEVHSKEQVSYDASNVITIILQSAVLHISLTIKSFYLFIQYLLR